MSNIIPREYEGHLIAQRTDGYIDATAMCRATGRKFAEYRRIGPTQEFLEALENDVSLPTSELIIVRKGGAVHLQGTWVHPQVAVNLAMWCNPRFAVQVSKWVVEILSSRTVSLNASEPPLTRQDVVEVVREVLASILPEILARPELSPAVRVHEVITPYDRCVVDGLWPSATPKQRERVIRLMVSKCHNRGIAVLQQGHRKNSPLGVHRNNMAIIDDAIRQIRDESMPMGERFELFQRGAAVHN